MNKYFNKLVITNKFIKYFYMEILTVELNLNIFINIMSGK